MLAEQIRLLVRKRVDLPINALNALIVATTLSQVYPRWVVAIWFTTFQALIVARYLSRRTYRAAALADAQAYQWGRIFAIGAFGTSLLWSMIGTVVLMTDDPRYHLFVFFVLGGMLAAGIVTNSAHIPTMTAFMGPIMVPAILSLLSAGKLIEAQMALMLVLFTGIVFASGRNINRAVIENLRLRIGQDTLLEKLRTSESRLMQAQALAHVGHWQANIAGDSLLLSEEALRILGVDPEKFKPTKTNVYARVHPDDQDLLKAHLANLTVDQSSSTFSFRVVLDDGVIKHLHAITRINGDAAGKAVSFTGIVQDVTERRIAEERIKFSNDLMVTEMETSRDAILIVDPTMKILSYNRRFVDLWQVPMHLLATEDDGAVLAAAVNKLKDPDAVHKRVMHLYNHPEDVSADLLETVDGRFIERYSATLKVPGKNPLGRVWYFRDVTERQLATIDLAYRDRLLRAVTECTRLLLASPSLEDGMKSALRTMGEIMEVDRAFVIEDTPGMAAAFSYRYFWEAPDIDVSLTTFDFASNPLDAGVLQAWADQLREGSPVVAQQETDRLEIQSLLASVNNKSMLILPIVIEGLLWGALVVDACKEARLWTAGEIDTLRIFADLAGAIIRRSEIQASLTRSEARFRELSATAQDAIISVDGDGLIEHWNASAERILGYTAQEVIGKPINAAMIPVLWRRQAEQALQTFRSTGGGSLLGETIELGALRKDGAEIAIEISLAGAQINGQWQAVGILRDITARKQSEASALRLARYDALTGLANRAVFVDALEGAIETAKYSARGLAVIYVDLDYFKDVNDTLGHPVGDELLKAVAARLLENTHGADTVARFGGDEFAIIVTGIADVEAVETLADKLIQTLSRPFWVDGNEIYSGASIGIAIYSPGAANAETLLSHADVALYRAKTDGRNGYRFFTPKMDEEVQSRVKLAAELRAAIDQGQLFLVYQPQVSLVSGEIVGVEALVRWQHPVRGVLGPDLFIPIAEQIGGIVKIGHWVLWTACRQGKAWLDSGIRPVRVAVNVSALQFRTPVAFEQDILAALSETGLPPDMLELELTETVLVDAARDHGALLQRLRAIGVTVAIDDFGTGYSSLDYLHRFPSNRLKIAQTFVNDIQSVHGGAAIVRATIGLAQELGIEVIAEGVETESQAKLLRAWGCTEGQGFLFSKPLAKTEIEVLLRDGSVLRRHDGRP